ncbi:YhgE/Pip domain-containing protein [Solibacillus sp. FSL W7-1464]|uniref:YhgE/Pip domain-containing protein n=1 Tax=Solibacillus sp. FSL W7-1464 TaxID=2921706 RepID=UPI0030F50DCA
MIKAEWLKIFKTKKMLISVIAVLFVPVMYSGMFLWAFWDPYANLKSLPVAVVNEDKGAMMDEETMELGQTLVDKLIDSEQFQFEEVDAKEADQKLLDQKYYILIKIPENFSEHATTLLDEEPQKLVIDYIPNEGFNFLGAQIGETAMDRIKAEVNTQVSATYAEKLFDSITQLGDGFTEAADGAGELDKGAAKLADGADELKGYLEQLASSSVQLSDGTDTLVTGAKNAAKGAGDLAAGVAKIADGSSQLEAGAKSAADGANTLQQGIESYTDGVAQVANGQKDITSGQASLAENLKLLTQGTANIDDKVKALADGSANVAGGMDQLAGQLEAILPMLPEENQAALKAALGQLQEGSKQVSGGLSQLHAGTNGLDDKIAAISEGASKLNAGQQQVTAGVAQLQQNSAQLIAGANSLAQGNTTIAGKLNELTAGASSAATGANTLAQGLNTLVDGSNKLYDGTSLLAEKSGELAQGSTTLADGTKELKEGTTTLSEKLTEAGEKAAVNPTEETYNMVGSPVEVEKDSVNHVPNYGTGFAPYFISLGLFVGALLISIVFPFVEPAVIPKNSASWFVSKVTVLIGVGLVQSFITIAIVVWGLGLEVNNMPQFILTTIITSFTFLAMVQLLVSVFGDPGRFIAIVVLILQLTTSAGTFPIELVPEQLHFFNKILPMTFSVQGFKAAISTGDTSFLMFNWSILGAVMISCLAITFGYFALLYKKRYSKQQTEQ